MSVTHDVTDAEADVWMTHLTVMNTKFMMEFTKSKFPQQVAQIPATPVSTQTRLETQSPAKT